MNANAYIDQSAAVIMTTVQHAKELGINRNKWVYLHGCADTYDHWYLSNRINYYSSPAMKVACDEALKMANCKINDIDFFDIYSCFPSAIKIACDEMNIDINTNKNLTVTGGLPYFGGPGNNYVTHSISEIMNRVRKNIGSKGMVTANGNYITKQSVGVYSSEPPNKEFSPINPNIYQEAINNKKGPNFINVANGNAFIETYTVINDKKGPSYAIVFGRLEDGSRFISNTPHDKNLLIDMMNNDYLNVKGLVKNKNNLNIFKPN
jgi:acetyl-CoA C-acetyltransferase